MRRHVIGQGKSPNERQVVEVNVKEGVAILKIIIMMQGDVKNSKT